jgi:Phosphotransferase enzyme family
MRPMPLPVVPEDVNAAWLTQALRERFPESLVEGVQILDIIRGTSTKIRVRPTYAPGHAADLPDTLIVKGGFEAHALSMREMYFTEMRFYRDVQPYVAIPSPACFYAGSDPESHQSIVILEDLCARGVRFCHAQRPQSREQLRRRLAVMARYHAQTWNSPEFERGGRFDWIGGRHEGWSLVYQERYLAPEVWQHYMDLPRGAAVPRLLRDRGWMRAALAYLGEYHRGSPTCLCHGDTHLGNLYEERDGSPGFFDPQVARAPWQFEVAYHLVGALDIVDRRRFEVELLRHYLDTLTAHGIAAPAFEVAWEAYRRELVYGLFIFLINETRFQTEAVNTAYAARFAAAALDHDSVRLTRGA